MLAETLTLADINQSLFDHGPLTIQYKYDGIRLQIERSIGFSGRSGKLLPNEYIQTFIMNQLCDARLDSEIMVRSEGGGWLPFADILLPEGKRVRGIESHVMSRLGAPDFCIMVFDDLSNPAMRYVDRLNLAYTQVRFLQSKGLGQYIENAPTWCVTNPDELLNLATNAIDNLGYEGIVLRAENGPYKQGRSTLNERLMLKYKPFVDDEAYVIGMEELYSNQSEKSLNRWGLVHRPSRMQDQIPMNTMGALLCRSAKFSDTFKIGTGFTPPMRDWFWRLRNSSPFAVTYKFQPDRGENRTRPRSPVFLRVRNSD